MIEIGDNVRVVKDYDNKYWLHYVATDLSFTQTYRVIGMSECQSFIELHHPRRKIFPIKRFEKVFWERPAQKILTGYAGDDRAAIMEWLDR